MRLPILFLLALMPLAAAVLSPDQQKRAEKLENSLLAPCCWAEPIAAHRSEVALAMKAEIVKLISEGRSDREIIDMYKSRYGERILVEPEGSQWWIMNAVPVGVTVLGFLVVALVIRRMLRPRPASSQ